METWLKFFAYWGGPHVLDSLLDYYGNPEAIPNDVTQVESARRARVLQQLTIRASILLHCVRDGDARNLILDHFVRRREAERRDEELAGYSGDALPPVRLGRSALEGLVKVGKTPKAAAGLVAG